MRHDTAGDPISGLKWSRRTTRSISEQLATMGIAASKNTVGRLLKQMGYKLRVNRKQIASTKSPDRNQQFLYIGRQRERFAAQGTFALTMAGYPDHGIGHRCLDGTRRAHQRGRLRANGRGFREASL